MNVENATTSSVEELCLIGTKSASLTLRERETIIVFNETNEPAEIFTYNKKLIRQLDSLCETREGIESVKTSIIEGAACKQYRIPKKWIKVTPPRILTDEQKTKLAERAQRMLAARTKGEGGES